MDSILSTFDPHDVDLKEFHYFASRMVSECARDYAMNEAVGEEDWHPVREYQKTISYMIGKLKAAHRDIGKLNGHAHKWSSDDYCVVCGADGRA